MPGVATAPNHVTKRPEQSEPGPARFPPERLIWPAATASLGLSLGRRGVAFSVRSASSPPGVASQPVLQCPAPARVHGVRGARLHGTRASFLPTIWGGAGLYPCRPVRSWRGCRAVTLWRSGAGVEDSDLEGRETLMVPVALSSWELDAAPRPVPWRAVLHAPTLSQRPRRPRLAEALVAVRDRTHTT